MMGYRQSGVLPALSQVLLLEFGVTQRGETPTTRARGTAGEHGEEKLDLHFFTDTHRFNHVSSMFSVED